MAEQLTSRRPYMLRATYEWLADNYLTPYILVNAKISGVTVPAHTVQDSQVVLNIGMNAVKQLELGNEAITFQARFAGKVESLYIPIDAVIAIYARENQQGMVFQDEGLAVADAGGAPEDGISDDSQKVAPESVERDVADNEGVASVVSDDKPEKPKGPGLSIVK